MLGEMTTPGLRLGNVSPGVSSALAHVTASASAAPSRHSLVACMVPQPPARACELRRRVQKERGCAWRCCTARILPPILAAAGPEPDTLS